MIRNIGLFSCVSLWPQYDSIKAAAIRKIGIMRKTLIGWAITKSISATSCVIDDDGTMFELLNAKYSYRT